MNTEHENTTELFQIWLNLPASKKMVEPAYKMLWNDSIPEAVFTNSQNKKTVVTIIAGAVGNVQAPAPAPDSWAADPENEVAIWHLNLEASASWELPAASKEVNRMFYFFEGDTLEVDGQEISPGKVLELVASQNVEIKNGAKASRCLLLQGKPINERVVQYGPFIMNSEAEIEQAFSDYRKSQFGVWPWPRPDQVFEKSKGRFAHFSDGSEVVK